jgi:alkanesulfonate monooxygenase SsuD/methylene tetrahydromethanopterin reductase-like flavin-dependent oxidoreductase (luciferase family)
LKFGICLFNWEPFSHTPQVYGELALQAEELGFDSVLVTDHFMRPHAPKDVKVKQHATIEAWSLLANLAAKTKTIKLGTCVTPIPLRGPQVLAKIVATLDVLSNGRAILGAGAGWDRGEFEAYGEWHSDAERVEMTKEGLQLIKELWTEDVVDFTGKFYKAVHAVLEPKPVQKRGPPIWSGAIHDKMLRLTAELCDGWIPGRAVGASLEYYGETAPRLKGYLDQMSGRKIQFGVMGYFLGPEASPALPAIGPMDRAAELIDGYRKLGCEYLSAVFLPLPRFKEMMRTFARDIVPSFS